MYMWLILIILIILGCKNNNIQFQKNNSNYDLIVRGNNCKENVCIVLKWKKTNAKKKKWKDIEQKEDR